MFGRLLCLVGVHRWRVCGGAAVSPVHVQCVCVKCYGAACFLERTDPRLHQWDRPIVDTSPGLQLSSGA